MNNILSFIVGDKVVYPNHGVGIIEQISSRTIGASVERCYWLKIKASSLSVMVPFNSVDIVGLGESSATAKSRRFWISSPTANARAITTGKTASRKIPTECAPARCMEVAGVLKSLLAAGQGQAALLP